MEDSLLNGRKADAVFGEIVTIENAERIEREVSKSLDAGGYQHQATVPYKSLYRDAILARVSVIYNQFRDDSAYMTMTTAERIRIINAATVSSIVEDLSVVLAERRRKQVLQASLLEGSLADPTMDNVKGTRTVNMMDNM